MLIDEIKKRMFAAMKSSDTVEKELLRTVIGEVTATGDEATDERVITAIRKMAKSTRETAAVATDGGQTANLQRELALLESFLPKTLSVEDIQAALQPHADAIRGAGNDGQATGIAMKHLKSSGAAVDGKDVAAAVKALRA